MDQAENQNLMHDEDEQTAQQIAETVQANNAMERDFYGEEQGLNEGVTAASLLRNPS